MLEVCECVSRPRLAELTGLGTMTVHRAAELMLDRGDVLRTRGADPVTGRMTTQLCPLFRVPVLLLDLTGRILTAYVACGTMLPVTELCFSESREVHGIFDPGDDLRQLLSETCSLLPRGIRELQPALLLPDTGLYRELPAADAARIMTDELEAGGFSLPGKGPSAKGAASVCVMREAEAAVYAAVRDPLTAGKQSLLLVRRAECRLLVRSSASGPWYQPAVTDGLSRAVEEALAHPGADLTRPGTLLSVVTPDAVLCDTGTDEASCALLRALLPEGVPVKAAAHRLAGRGILMRARRETWMRDYL